MLRPRIIPALLLRNDALVKTINFRKPRYIGDPINTVRIFNELEVDELMFLDITATNEKRPPKLKILAEIANECFMPLAYGGGVDNFETLKAIFSIGFEKVVLNSVMYSKPSFITQVADYFGSQAVVASIDVKKSLFGRYEVWTHAGKTNVKKNPVEWAEEVEQLGASEILLTSIDREGTWSGFDTDLIKKVTDAVDIPVIAHGGAGSLEHIGQAVKNGHANAVALGSMVVYQQRGMGVLVNFPDQQKLEEVIR